MVFQYTENVQFFFKTGFSGSPKIENRKTERTGKNRKNQKKTHSYFKPLLYWFPNSEEFLYIDVEMPESNQSVWKFFLRRLAKTVQYAKPACGK